MKKKIILFGLILFGGIFAATYSNIFVHSNESVFVKNNTISGDDTNLDQFRYNVGDIVSVVNTGTAYTDVNDDGGNIIDYVYPGKTGRFICLTNTCALAADWKRMNNMADEYEEVDLSTNTVTTTSSVIDVLGASITLTPGTWQIGYYAAVQWDTNQTGGNSLEGKVHITDASNNDLEGTASMFGSTEMNDVSTNTSSVAKATQITITATTTYKMRIQCTDATATGVCRVLGGSNQTGSLTDDDAETVFYAKRVK